MSSHREAPKIAKDPVADSTDTYFFVSPDRPDTVTIITNYVPLEGPAGGPNFYEFGDDVLYEINIDNDGDGRADLSFHFRFTTEVSNPNTFLYNTGQILSLNSPNWNRKQFYTISQRLKNRPDDIVMATHLSCPPNNIGPRSTPNYAALATAAIHTLPDGKKVFAGQRREGFYVDLGSIFDLGALRPVQNLHLIPMAATTGIDATKDLNVHTIAIQMPFDHLFRDGTIGTGDHPDTVGIWAAAYRQKSRIIDDDVDTNTGPFVQISRLGNPLFNEVIVPMARKDLWNVKPPHLDSDFAQYVLHPELAGLLPFLYPGVFPNLAAYTADRVDLAAILLTGIPAGIIPGFHNFTGPTQADILRLNYKIPPSPTPSPLGLLGGDLAGFPNGRRVFDDTVTIELQAVAGATIPLVDPTYTPDGAVSAVTQGVTPDDGRYISEFPYLGVPKDGFDTPAS